MSESSPKHRFGLMVSVDGEAAAPVRDFADETRATRAMMARAVTLDYRTSAHEIGEWSVSVSAPDGAEVARTDSSMWPRVSGRASVDTPTAPMGHRPRRPPTLNEPVGAYGIDLVRRARVDLRLMARETARRDPPFRPREAVWRVGMVGEWVSVTDWDRYWAPLSPWALDAYCLLEDGDVDDLNGIAAMTPLEIERERLRLAPHGYRLVRRGRADADGRPPEGRGPSGSPR